MYGLGKPMFAVIVLSVILAAVSGKLISSSGAVQTIAAYVVAAGFTARLYFNGPACACQMILFPKNPAMSMESPYFFLFSNGHIFSLFL